MYRKKSYLPIILDALKYTSKFELMKKGIMRKHREYSGELFVVNIVSTGFRVLYCQ
jgi:hypothetical protein